MKKMVLSVIWLAIAGVFTIMTMSACSDDDENNSTNGGGITIEGVDQAEYFRKNLGIFAENDSILLPIRMTVLDALTVFCIYYSRFQRCRGGDVLEFLPQRKITLYMRLN